MAEEIKQEKAQAEMQGKQAKTGATKKSVSAKGTPADSSLTATAAQKVFTEDELNAAVKAAVAEAMKNIQAQPTVVQVEKTEYVELLFLGQFAEGTSVVLPLWGQITRTGETLDVPKKDFLRGLGKQTNKEFLKNRKLLVVNGVTPEERKRFGIDYKEGEVLTQSAYYKLLQLPQEEVCGIYSRLCDEHKELVARVFYTAYFEKWHRDIPIETVKALNEISKSVRPEGLFRLILKDKADEYTE